MELFFHEQREITGGGWNQGGKKRVVASGTGEEGNLLT